MQTGLGLGPRLSRPKNQTGLDFQALADIVRILIIFPYPSLIFNLRTWLPLQFFHHSSHTYVLDLTTTNIPLPMSPSILFPSVQQIGYTWIFNYNVKQATNGPWASAPPASRLCLHPSPSGRQHNQYLRITSSSGGIG